MADFASTLKRIRLERGLTQEELGKILETSKQNISRYENGEVSPNITSFARIAEKLGVSLSELNGEDATDDSPATDTTNNSRREMVLHYLTALSTENQMKWLEYAQLLLLSQKSDPDSRG